MSRLLLLPRLHISRKLEWRVEQGLEPRHSEMGCECPMQHPNCCTNYPALSFMTSYTWACEIGLENVCRTQVVSDWEGGKVTLSPIHLGLGEQVDYPYLKCLETEVFYISTYFGFWNVCLNLQVDHT